MRFETFIIGIILFGSLITGFYVFLGDLTGEEGYSIDVSNDTAYKAAYNKTERVSSNIADRYGYIKNMSTSGSASFFTGAVEAVKMVKDIIVLPYDLLAGENGVINTLAGSKEDRGLDIPGWVAGMVIVIILIMLVFAFIYILIKVNA